MESYFLDEDIVLAYVTAESFPLGVMDAHNKLHALLPENKDRTYYGLSNPDAEGTIIYRAAAEELAANEAEKAGCKTFVLKKGKYMSIFIPDYCENIPAIGQAFQDLIALPDIDHTGCCVEMYLDDTDVRCMVRLADR